MRDLHRWGGLISAAFLVVLAVTGVLLNHLPAYQMTDRIGRIQAVLPGPDGLPLWLGTSTGLYRMTVDDRPERVWLRTSDPSVSALLRDGASLAVAFEKGDLFVSPDGGQRWTRLPVPPEVRGLKGLSGTPSRMLVVTETGVYQVAGPREWRLVRTFQSARSFREWVHAVHTGYFFRPVLPYLYDGAAIVLVLLVITGIGIALTRRSPKAPRRLLYRIQRLQRQWRKYASHKNE